MTTVTIRQKLISYLADAEESKVKALYLLLEKELVSAADFTLSAEQLEFLESERKMHLTNQTESYSRQQALDIIRGEKGI